MGSGIYSRICEMEGIVKVIFGKYNLPQKIRKLKLIWYEKVSQWTGLGPLSDSVLKEIISGKVTFRQKYRWFKKNESCKNLSRVYALPEAMVTGLALKWKKERIVRRKETMSPLETNLFFLRFSVLCKEAEFEVTGEPSFFYQSGMPMELKRSKNLFSLYK